MVGLVVLIRVCPDTVRGFNSAMLAVFIPEGVRGLVTVILVGIAGAMVSITQVSDWVPFPELPDKSWIPLPLTVRL